jgi:hypothetical protein
MKSRDARLDDLERRVKELEDRVARQLPWHDPFPHPMPPHQPQPHHPTWPPNESGVRCISCGMLWQGVMGYCCPNAYCPMGAGPITFNSTKPGPFHPKP